MTTRLFVLCIATISSFLFSNFSWLKDNLLEYYSCITNTGFRVLSITFLTVLPIARTIDVIFRLAITIKSMSDSSAVF